jgi:hypothetical protein
MRTAVIIVISLMSTIVVGQRRDTVYVDSNKKMILKSAFKPEDRSLIQIDGQTYNGLLENIDVKLIESVDVLNPETANAVFGKEARNGAILFKTANLDQQKIANERLEKLKRYVGGFKQNKPLIIVNDTIYKGELKFFNANDITNVDIIESDYAIKSYGQQAKYGAIVISTKQKIDPQGIFTH